jgi:hypothetical protein
VFGKELYDDFSGDYLDSTKWEYREKVREIDSGKLVLKIGNESSSGSFRSRTRFANAGLINTIECEVTVVTTVLESGSDPMSFARVDGFFYNKYASGDSTGDIWVGVYIGDRGNGLEAWWAVEEKLDDNGDDWDVLGEGTLIDPGTLSYGTAYTVRISYNGSNGITFTVNGAEDTFTGPTRQRAAVNEFKALDTGIDVDGGGSTGYSHALFDNVYINDQTAAYDTFNTAPLDATKWESLEVVREISGGKLRLSVQGCDSRENVTMNPLKYDRRYIEAKVLIDSDSEVPSNNEGFARMSGLYYNDSRGPGSGQPYNGNVGDVFVSNRLIIDNTGKLKAVAGVFRLEDVDGTTGQSLLWQEFSTPISYDTEYTLSIKHYGTSFWFKCNDETITYQVTTDMYEPSEEWQVFQSRVYADPGECGYLKAQFDDVYIGEFKDVPPDYWAEEFINKIYENGITSGCSQDPLMYCPEDAVTRSQMAVFLERGINGSDYSPPGATGVFDDCPVSHWAADWIEQFYADGITSGCSTNPLMYCPDDLVTRAQMAVFLLRSMYGNGYTPPSAEGIFDDVPVTHWAADWIEQLYDEGITGGCSTNPPLYCPDDLVTRAEMAVFIVRTFDL